MKKRTAKSMLAEADQIKAALESGKIKGKKAQQSAMYRIGNLRYRAGVKQKKVIESANLLLKEGQGFLPGILKDLDLVRIEELVADKLFQELGKAEQKVKAKKSNKKAA